MEGIARSIVVVLTFGLATALCYGAFNADIDVWQKVAICVFACVMNAFTYWRYILRP